MDSEGVDARDNKRIDARDNKRIDARGLKCPLPVLKMEKRLTQLPRGARLVVLATDPIAKVDIPLYCRQHGHQCSLTSEGDVMRFSIIKSV